MDRVQSHIATIDLAVIAVYLAIVLAIGIWVARRTSTGEDLFLAGRSLAWGAIGLSLFASNISTTTLMGLTGAAYSSGIATSAFEWMAGIPLRPCSSRPASPPRPSGWTCAIRARFASISRV